MAARARMRMRRGRRAARAARATGAGAARAWRAGAVRVLCKWSRRASSRAETSAEKDLIKGLGLDLGDFRGSRLG